MKHAVIVISFFVLVGLWSGAMNITAGSLVSVVAASLLVFTYRERCQLFFASLLKSETKRSMETSGKR